MVWTKLTLRSNCYDVALEAADQLINPIGVERNDCIFVVVVLDQDSWQVHAPGHVDSQQQEIMTIWRENMTFDDVFSWPESAPATEHVVRSAEDNFFESPEQQSVHAVESVATYSWYLKYHRSITRQLHLDISLVFQPGRLDTRHVNPFNCLQRRDYSGPHTRQKSRFLGTFLAPKGGWLLGILFKWSAW